MNTHKGLIPIVTLIIIGAIAIGGGAFVASTHPEIFATFAPSAEKPSTESENQEIKTETKSNTVATLDANTTKTPSDAAATTETKTSVKTTPAPLPSAPSTQTSHTFVTHNSSVGFSVKYPTGWTIHEVIDVETWQGNVLFFAKDAKMTNGTPDELLAIYTQAADLESFRNIDSMLSNEAIKRTIENMVGKPIVVGKVDRNVNIPTPYVTAYFDQPSRNKKGVVKMIAIGISPKVSSYPVAIFNIAYIADSKLYSSATAETFINSFTEKINQTFAAKTGQSIPDVPIRTRIADANIKRALMSLRVYAEQVFSESHSYQPVCFDGLLNKSGDPVYRDAIDMIREAKVGVANWNGTDIVCASNQQAFAISIPLIESGKSWCIDSAESEEGYSTVYGISGTIKPGTYACSAQ